MILVDERAATLDPPKRIPHCREAVAKQPAKGVDKQDERNAP